MNHSNYVEALTDSALRMALEALDGYGGDESCHCGRCQAVRQIKKARLERGGSLVMEMTS